MTTREFLSHLKNVKVVRGGWMARCPAHDDRNPSLSVSENGGRILLHCHAGCETSAIVAALGLQMSDLFTDFKPSGNDTGAQITETYDYTDETGKPLFQVLRYAPKSFKQRRPDGRGGWIYNLDGVRRVLYNLPEVINADSVLVCEGEKDCETAKSLGFFATCNPGGAGKWLPEYSEFLRGKSVTVIADADEPGRIHAQKVAASLQGKAESIRVIELPGAKDLADWLALGESDHDGAREQLLNLIHEAPEWKPATGAGILDSVMQFVKRFVSLTDAQARAVALWVVHTHAMEAADCTPYLAINSAEKQSGKTRLLEVMKLLVAKPWFTSRVTAAVLARKVDAESPSLLLDESDAAFGADKEYAEALRGMLNSGYRRGGCTSLCVGQGASITYKDFGTFCPKAIAGLSRLPDTVADRSIPIRLKRARRGEVRRFRESEVSREAGELQAKIAAGATENLSKLRDARPAIPDALSDRQADTCEPLLAIADAADGEWPGMARLALAKLCVGAQADDDSIGVRLLKDIQAVFAEKDVEELPSSELAESLAAIETSPWGECNKGKPLSPAKLARLLKPFEIYPTQIGDHAARGYRRVSFKDAFTLYLAPVPPLESVHVSETRIDIERNVYLKVSAESSPDTLEKSISANNDAPSGHLDTLKLEIRGPESTKTETIHEESTSYVKNGENSESGAFLEF